MIVASCSAGASFNQTSALDTTVDMATPINESAAPYGNSTCTKMCLFKKMRHGPEIRYMSVATTAHILSRNDMPLGTSSTWGPKTPSSTNPSMDSPRSLSGTLRYTGDAGDVVALKAGGFMATTTRLRRTDTRGVDAYVRSATSLMPSGEGCPQARRCRTAARSGEVLSGVYCSTMSYL